MRKKPQEVSRVRPQAATPKVEARLAAEDWDMVNERGQLNEFDRLMLEAAEAERAGVFQTTLLDVESVVGEPAFTGPVYWYRHLLVGLPLAACIAMFFGVAALWQTGTRTGEVLMTGTTAVSTLSGGMTSPAEPCQGLENFRSCLGRGGPGILVDRDCHCVDFDGDGDVDLRDLGTYQVSRTID